jgi:DNA polymerase-3 subunit epsilon
MNFVAVDVETANADLSSICQIGVASFRDGMLNDSWASLVNPRDYFDAINVSIHGIDEQTVRASPDWSQTYQKVSSLLNGKIVVSHTPFDRAALLRACDKIKVAHCDCQWLDSARVVRRAWPVFSRSGYGLANVAAAFRIEYKAHDALEDARCAGEILLRAIAETGLSIDQWLERVRKPIDESASLPITREGNTEGPLHGEVLVFTGALLLPRHQAADLAATAGCEVAASVTKHTTLLVVGDQDIRKLAGHDKSLKHRKAEGLIAKGQNIRIITESDFQHIVTM